MVENGKEKSRRVSGYLQLISAGTPFRIMCYPIEKWAKVLGYRKLCGRAPLTTCLLSQ